ncbi:hypothetical protein ACHAXR_012017 [Thalassiosira sp. AJA248-18]
MADSNDNSAGNIDEIQLLLSRPKGSSIFSVDDTPKKQATTAHLKRRSAAKLIILAFIILFALETRVQRWLDGGHSKSRKYPRQSEKRLHKSSQKQKDYTAYFISDTVKNEYHQWHKRVRSLSQMELQLTNWTPDVNWGHHPRERSDRFPTVQERVQYYMGKWHNTTIPMYGPEFEKATFIQRKTTREYGTFSDILQNLYNLDKSRLYKCYQNKKELHVMSPYCRDYIDVAILHSEGSANVLHNIGDGLPFVPEEIRKYPMLAKVRPLCNYGETAVDARDFENNLCKQKKKIEPILLPLNRKRHFGAASIVPENDIPWEEKIGRAVWRGQYGKTHDTLSDTNDIKYALVSKHLNSTLVDAMFSKHTKDAPTQMIGNYLDVKDQLTYKYIISIEGNDVSSGLKWMLFSNSVVLTPQFTWESWAMEGKLEAFKHYIPLKADMSNVEEMIQWAEMNPEKTRNISERSTLYIYDLLFHPDAIEDEREVIINIMERFEQNFGSKAIRPRNIQWNKHPSDRALRVPSVEERVKYAMGKWYHNRDGLSMKRSNLENMPLPILNSGISKDELFVASGQKLSSCATTNNEVRLLCKSSLPEFDERNTADLKSNSFNRLKKTTEGKNMKLAPKSSWRQDGKGMKESKRVLLDDSIKIFCYGFCSQDGVNVPYFARFRGKEDAIIWPFGGDNTVNIVKSGWIETVDKDFQDKKPTAISRDKTNQQTTTLTSLGFVSGDVEAATGGFTKKFFLDHHSESKRKDHIREMLSHRYLLATENENSINEDLLWMLLSQSVVLMPAELRVTSWLMEGFLKPYIHFVPVASDNSDIDDKILWCENNREEARMVSERATLFVYDMLLDMRSERENEEVKFRVMERYSKLFG